MTVFTIWQTLDLKRDDRYNFDENDGKVYNKVENIVGKGIIAHYECFQDLYSNGLFEKGLRTVTCRNCDENDLPLPV